jgi:hypothetical protein
MGTDSVLFYGCMLYVDVALSSDAVLALEGLWRRCDVISVATEFMVRIQFDSREV